jgi:ribosome recycling factor
MNPVNILMLAITFIQLNAGQSVAAKQVIKEAMDVVQSIGKAMKDKKITMDEKKAVVKELREFTDATIKAFDSIIIPE